MLDQVKTGAFIAQLRREKGLTQEQLAEKLGTTGKSVSRWENGKNMPDLSLFEPICRELGITVNELMSGERLDKEDYQTRLEGNIIDTINTSQTRTKRSLNKRVVALSAVLGLLAAVAVMFMIDFVRMNNYRPVIFGTWGFDYKYEPHIDTQKIKEVLEDYCAEMVKCPYHGNEQGFAAGKVYGIAEDGNDIKAYFFMLSISHYEKDGQVYECSGSSGFFAAVLNADMKGNYSVKEFLMPGGDKPFYTEEELREMFPESIFEEMPDAYVDGTVELSMEDILMQVERYYGIENYQRQFEIGE